MEQEDRGHAGLRREGGAGRQRQRARQEPQPVGDRRRHARSCPPSRPPRAGTRRTTRAPDRGRAARTRRRRGSTRRSSAGRAARQRGRVPPSRRLASPMAPPRSGRRRTRRSDAPSANRGHRDRRSSAPNATTGASTIATLPPETTSRCDSPLARKSRSSTGSSFESSPRARPRSRPASRGGNISTIESPISVRTDLRPSDRGERRVAEPSDLVDQELGRDPSPVEERGEPAFLGDLERPGDAEPVAAERVRRRIVAGQPYRLADTRCTIRPGDRADVEHGGPAAIVGLRVDAQRALDRHARQAPAAPRGRRARGARAPTPSRSPTAVTPTTRQGEASPHRAAAIDVAVPRAAGGTSIVGSRRRARRVPAARATMRRPGSAPRRARERARRRRRARALRTASHTQASTASPIQGRTSSPDHSAGGERRKEPAAHTVTSSRIESRIASPMPLTSTSWSTDVNGPFAVRWSMMRCAITSPIPGSASRSVADAVLTLTSPPADAPVLPDRRSAGRSLARHEDLRPVDQQGREVQRLQERARPGTAGSLDRVDDPGSLGERVDARVADPSRDVDEQRGAGGRARLRGARRRWARSPSREPRRAWGGNARTRGRRRRS